MPRLICRECKQPVLQFKVWEIVSEVNYEDAEWLCGEEVGSSLVEDGGYRCGCGELPDDLEPMIQCGRLVIEQERS